MCAVLAGVGCAPLPRMLVHSALNERQLLELLPGWAPPAGTVQAAFASHRGMRPAVRQLLDFLAKEFAQLAREGCYLPVV
uniref:LysR substrate-binding domain-containing protein n=1 Tax=Thauera sp. SDU_THAU2 TaxID=3136633 RepID=UPI00311F4143